MSRRLSRCERERKRIEDAEFVRRQRERIAESALSICEKHPGWRPTVAGLAPPASECPFCKRDALANRDTARDEYEAEHPAYPSTPRLTERWERWKHEHPERVGIEPGSFAEADALARIEELREDERASEARRSGGRFATGRIENGQWIEFHVPLRRGRTGAIGLVRMAP